MTNAENALDLDEAVAEVLGLLTGLDLQYSPSQDRYQSIVRQINRAQRSVALEREWSSYSDQYQAGTASLGQRAIHLSSNKRVRAIGDDAILFVDTACDPEVIVQFAYFLPRDAIHKYQGRAGLWAAATGQDIVFSRPFTGREVGCEIRVPVMREPKKFRLPGLPANPNDPLPEVPLSVREQLIDFPYPDLVVLKAAYFYAQTDPLMQPRVPTLDAQYKDHLYQVIERDERRTDDPFLNEFLIPVQSGLIHPGPPHHSHPHSDERR